MNEDKKGACLAVSRLVCCRIGDGIIINININGYVGSVDVVTTFFDFSSSESEFCSFGKESGWDERDWI